MLAAVLRSRTCLPRTSIPPRYTPQRWKQTASRLSNSEQPASSPQNDASDAPQEPSSPALTYLPRPLGVDKKPTTQPLSWQEKRDELLDYDKHLEKRRHLVKEATRGYFQDFHALKHHKGKTWIAPNVLIREDKALYFPDVSGVSLAPQETVHTTSIFEGRISIVSVISTVMSEENVKSFNVPVAEAYQSHPLFRFVQINLQENVLKGFLVSMFLSSIRARTPAHLQSTYIVSRQNMEYLREPLGMVNKHIGYVYLVDENCKIRWGGCGFAMDEETEALKNCTRVLLRRLDKRASETSTTSSSTEGGSVSQSDVAGS